MNVVPARVQVGRSTGAVVRTGVSGGTIAMASLAALALGGLVFLVTAKPIYAGIAVLAGAFIGSQLGSETGA